VRSTPDKSVEPTVPDPDLVEQVARLTAVVDGLSTAVVICDAAGEITHRNLTAKVMHGTHTGLLIEEVVDRHLAMAINPGAEVSPAEELDLFGPPRQVMVVRAMRLDNGGAYALIEDVTERRRIDSVRTDFVANISHELKTPVGALAVLAETLVEEEDLEIVRRISDRLLEEAHRAAHTIDDLLELSRIELDGGQYTEPVEVTDLIDAALERAAPLSEAKQITVEVRIRGPLSLRANRRQLESALGNLVENAVKYSEPGTTVVVVCEKQGDSIDFVVSDQGVGIPVQDLDRIFERFYRVDKARSRGTGGSGLGLAIVRHVATNHHGQVLVASEEGRGSRFTLRIPHRSDDALLGASVTVDDPSPTLHPPHKENNKHL
jgi:two-component system, OmpR family, sensor histidine kinase SenX3